MKTVFAILALIVLVAGMSIAQKPRDPLAAKKTQALSNLKQLTVGTLIYASDYDDLLPYTRDTDTVFAVTFPYIKSKELLKSSNPNGGRIEFNLRIGGVALRTIRDPNAVPMFFDSKPWPDSKRPVSFVDGHVIFASPDQWKQFQAQMKKKLARAAKGQPLPKTTIEKMYRM